jgi:hypothetical protein
MCGYIALCNRRWAKTHHSRVLVDIETMVLYNLSCLVMAKTLLKKLCMYFHSSHTGAAWKYREKSWVEIVSCVCRIFYVYFFFRYDESCVASFVKIAYHLYKSFSLYTGSNLYLRNHFGLRAKGSSWSVSPACNEIWIALKSWLYTSTLNARLI